MNGNRYAAKPPEKRHSVTVATRLTPTEAGAMTRRASLLGLSMSSLLRAIVLQSLRATTKEGLTSD